MKTKKLLLFIFTVLVCASCTNEIERNSTCKESIFVEELNMSIDYLKDQNVLVFESKEDFEAVVSKLELNSASNIIDLSKPFNGLHFSSIGTTFKNEGFISLYDEFVSAMDEAEKYCDTKEGYLKFKEKYSSLYFPEYGDDYSAYLPVENKYVAKLLNSKGEVMINGNIVNLIDIHSYKQLVVLGLTPPEDDSKSVTIRSVNYLELNELTEKFNSDYTRKLWVLVKLFPSSTPAVREYVKVEVCFRKKGAFGIWYNYSDSETRLGPSAEVYNTCTGYSSHDAVYYKGEGNYNENGTYIWPTIKMTLCVQYRGIYYTPYYFRVEM